jgi:hypothetical protein
MHHVTQQSRGETVTKSRHQIILHPLELTAAAPDGKGSNLLLPCSL